MNPLRSRNVSLAVCGVGAATWAAALWLPVSEFVSAEVYKSVLAAGAIGTVFGLTAALMFAIPAAGEARLRGGRDVIARWHVDAGRWAAFVAYDASLATAKPLPAQRIAVTRRMLTNGADVVVGKTGLLVGDRYWILDNGFMVVAGLRFGPPLCVEFQFNVVTGEGPDMDYRLGVPAEHENDAKAADVVTVHDALLSAARERAARVPPGLIHRHPARWRKMSLWVLGMCLAAIAWSGAAIVQGAAQPLHGLVLGSGLIVGMGAAVLALVAHLVVRSGRTR